MPEPECEFKEVCEKTIRVTNHKTGLCFFMIPTPKRKLSRLPKCFYRDFAILVQKKALNSPQFREQYANREELVDAIIKFDEDEMPYALSHIVEFIRTHGLKEE